MNVAKVRVSGWFGKANRVAKNNRGPTGGVSAIHTRTRAQYGEPRALNGSLRAGVGHTGAVRHTKHTQFDTQFDTPFDTQFVTQFVTQFDTDNSARAHVWPKSGTGQFYVRRELTPRTLITPLPIGTDSRAHGVRVLVDVSRALRGLLLHTCVVVFPCVCVNNLLLLLLLLVLWNNRTIILRGLTEVYNTGLVWELTNKFERFSLEHENRERIFHNRLRREGDNLNQQTNKPARLKVRVLYQEH